MTDNYPTQFTAPLSSAALTRKSEQERLERAMAAAQSLGIDDVSRLQLMEKRLLKAIGNRVKARVILGALASVTGKVFTVIPKDAHPAALAEYNNLVFMAVRNEYSPEEKEQARQRALVAMKVAPSAEPSSETTSAKSPEPT